MFVFYLFQKVEDWGRWQKTSCPSPVVDNVEPGPAGFARRLFDCLQKKNEISCRYVNFIVKAAVGTRQLLLLLRSANFRLAPLFGSCRLVDTRP